MFMNDDSLHELFDEKNIDDPIYDYSKEIDSIFPTLESLDE